MADVYVEAVSLIHARYVDHVSWDKLGNAALDVAVVVPRVQPVRTSCLMKHA